MGLLYASTKGAVEQLVHEAALAVTGAHHEAHDRPLAAVVEQRNRA